MDFVELVKQFDRDLFDSCDKNALQRLGRALSRSKTLEPLIKQNDKTLLQFQTAQLLKLTNLYDDFSIWKIVAQDVRRSLAKSGLSIPDGSLQSTASPNDLYALERTARMCQRSGHSDHISWSKAVTAHVELWRACLKIGKKEGYAVIEEIDSNNPEQAVFASHATQKTMLTEMRGYHWLGARRGEKANALTIKIILPRDSIQTQAEARLNALGITAQNRSIDSLLEELIYNDLENTLKKELDKKAEREAIDSASKAYASLLETPPLKPAKAIIAVYIGTNTMPTGIVVLTEKGEITEKQEVPSADDSGSILTALVKKHSPSDVILPTTATDGKRLRDILDTLSDQTVTQVAPSAVSEAGSKLKLPKSIARAIVLGRRALNPISEWTKVNPISLGLGEYVSDINQDILGKHLANTRLLTVFQYRNKNKIKTGVAKAAAPQKRLNPMIRTIRDLKPGMTVSGVVTNLTRFGAFVNIGLLTEGMIHVSQLSTEFVDEPSQIVRIGQNLRARVLEVIPEKNRIALSLKPAPVLGERSAPRDRSGQANPLDALDKKPTAPLSPMSISGGSDHVQGQAPVSPAFSAKPQITKPDPRIGQQQIIRPKQIKQSDPSIKLSESTFSSPDPSLSKTDEQPKPPIKKPEPQRGKNSDTKSRHEALADLHALFKK